jgi:hypothetical protein
MEGTIKWFNNPRVMGLSAAKTDPMCSSTTPGLWETDIERCKRETVSASSWSKDQKDRKQRMS